MEDKMNSSVIVLCFGVRMAICLYNFERVFKEAILDLIIRSLWKVLHAVIFLDIKKIMINVSCQLASRFSISIFNI